MSTKLTRVTRQIEMVETYNIALCLSRVRHHPEYDSERWKRVLYHSIAMAGVASRAELEAMRIGMGIP